MRNATCSLQRRKEDLDSGYKPVIVVHMINKCKLHKEEKEKLLHRRRGSRPTDSRKNHPSSCALQRFQAYREGSFLSNDERRMLHRLMRK